jgi:hypothetical protein
VAGAKQVDAMPVLNQAGGTIRKIPLSFLLMI